jgi:glycosyltransferase involved in cell wall biosynthesis
VVRGLQINLPKLIPMRLLIISNMPHHRRDAQIAGWGPTVHEIDYLARRFTNIRHVGCLHDGPAPANALPYSAANVTFVPLTPKGGKGIWNKLGILVSYPSYIRTIFRELRSADVVQVRCPGNIGLLAIMLLAFARKPRRRWAKYAGNWRPNRPEAWSYTFQRWWLDCGLHRGFVTVNGRWPGQPNHVHSFLNPCLTEGELRAATEVCRIKSLSQPVRLLFVGLLGENKGGGRAVEILGRLRQQGVLAELDMIGDGPERPAFEARAVSLGVNLVTRFHGWLPRSALGEFYAASHFVLLPSCSEGWPKVLSEGMAYGAVPLASNVGSIPQTLADCGCGKTFAPLDTEGICQAIREYTRFPDCWKTESANGVKAAELFTYERYVAAIERLLDTDAQSLGGRDNSGLAPQAGGPDGIQR